MKLVQVRECDGQCCRESPRWPNDNGSCRYLDDKGCKIKRGEAKVPRARSPALPDMTAAQAYRETCEGWPQNSPEGRGTGGCCWQWVDGD